MKLTSTEIHQLKIKIFIDVITYGIVSINDETGIMFGIYNGIKCARDGNGKISIKILSPISSVREDYCNVDNSALQVISKKILATIKREKLLKQRIIKSL